MTSTTASDVVRYLAAYEQTNLGHLPRARIAKQMGWQGERGDLGFLWGRSLIRGEPGPLGEVDVNSVDPEDWGEDSVFLLGSDAGDEQLAAGYHTAGSYESWRDGVGVIAAHPPALIALYGSLAPPLLAILDAPNFIIDLCGSTTTGKTIVLRVAASCWGNPDERAPASAMSTWDGTRVWVERASAVLNGLPLILDDTKLAKRPTDIAGVLYSVANGRGRGRGSPCGMRRASSWTTVLLSSGEAPATSFTQDGGTRARVITLWGLPFNHADASTAKLVNGLDMAVRQHYGHAGPRFVQYLLVHRHEWDALRAAYQHNLAEYLTKARGNALAGRLAGYFAALKITGTLAHTALDLHWRYDDPVERLWDKLVAEANQADRAKAALAYVYSWALGHQADFWERHARIGVADPQPRQPNAGWAGRWDGNLQVEVRS